MGRPELRSWPMGEIIEFPSNGNTAGGYLAVPEGGSGPGVLVIQEWWGLVDHIKDVCERFAGAGFVALAPDLYHGHTVPPGEPDEAGKAMMAMKMDRAARDMSGAVDELVRRSEGDKVGVIGFCMGGGLALVLATQRPDAIAAVIPCYGVIPWPDAQPDYSKLAAPVQGHYAENDTFFTPEAANALADELRSMGKSVEIFVYPDTDHAFFNDTRQEVHDPDAARALWDRSIAFLNEHLRH
jgi:carboxymethylenebutenolidase